MKVKGTIRKSDIEMGVWQLIGPDGEVFQLGGNTKGIQEGPAEVEGDVDKNTMGFGMTGPQLTVAKITPLKK